MNRLFAYIGVAAVATKSTYYFCLLSYFGITAFSAYVIAESKTVSQNCPLQTTIWILTTNIAAFLSGLMFWKTSKGTFFSVTGMFLYVLNFLNMITLYFYCISTLGGNSCKLTNLVKIIYIVG